ncbi:MAG: hypothetical protein HY936_11480 [Nitrosomonadales bacterium]|nr:hypothetical protein [Nitrosomonadales bacterium]
MRLHDLSLAARVTIGVLSMVAAGTATLLLVENAHLRDVYLSERRARLEQDLETETLQLTQAINTLRQDVLFLSDMLMKPALQARHYDFKIDEGLLMAER